MCVGGKVDMYVFNGGFPYLSANVDYSDQINLTGWVGVALGLACSTAFFSETATKNEV